MERNTGYVQHEFCGEGCPNCTLKFVVGDATYPQGTGRKIIAHICNDIGAWGSGFVLAVSKRWAEPREAYLDWYKNRCSDGIDFNLGAVQFVPVESYIVVANMIGQRGIRSNTHYLSSPALPTIRYEAVALCLHKLANYALENDATVHMPRIGCGLAGGSWQNIEPLIVNSLCARSVPVTVYDLPG